MSTPSEKLAAALTELKALQDKNIIAIKSSSLSRIAKQRLTANGFLKEVIKGWYIPYFPTTQSGETTIWYSSFWKFSAQYCRIKFGDEWCLSPEQSLLIHAGNWSVPKQLMVRSPRAGNKIINLLCATSILDVRSKMPAPGNLEVKSGLNIFSLESALILCSSKFFTQHPTDARTVLASIRDVSPLLRALLRGDHSIIASRLIGAFENIGMQTQADTISNSMKKLGYEIRVVDPFTDNIHWNFSNRARSPYALRLQIMWHEMRTYIINSFPKPKSKHQSSKEYLHDIDEKYVNDAYHSLSIEGYHVSSELIMKVRKGKWDPTKLEEDQGDKDALAAHGYWLAFKQVRGSISKVLQGANAGKIAKTDHQNWYAELFRPCLTAGILKEFDLIGYRNHQIYIQGSKHVPPNKDAIVDMLEAFFDLIENETEASVRIVLGHFFFVYIHPYMDGNGRMGRFLMNVMCSSGEYPWTIIPVTSRKEYMRSLEAASVQQDIKPFCDFIASLMWPSLC